MKKFLSLVMALVMTMSLVTISAGAKDFTDDSKIAYKEAVDVLSAVKVIDGYTDGAFKPTTSLNRGQAAKILCNMILGPTTAGALKADAAPFKDVPADSTFAGYIAYCAQAGIIDGYTDGTFRPTAPLTGYAFMKLLLGALGYDKDVEGYNVPNWSINVAKRALSIGLDKGLADDFNGTKIVTREEAALYAFNTLKATMVEYKNASTIVVGDITVSTNSKATEVNTGNVSGIWTETPATLQFAEKYFPKLDVDGAQTDVYGRPATKWSYKNDEVGTYAKEADAVYTSNPKMYTVTKDLGYSTSENANFYYVLNVAEKQVVGTGKIAVNYYQSSDTSSKLADFDALKTYVGNGVTVEIFYDDKTSSVQNQVVVIDEYFDEVKAVKSDDDGTYVTLKGSAGKFYTENFAKGDKVLFTKGNTFATKIASMKPAEKLTGKLTTIDGTKYIISGTTYELHNGYKPSGLTAGKDVEFYLDSNGYIIKIALTEASEAVDNLAIVIDTNPGAWKTEGKVVYASGKIGIVTLKDTNTATNTVYSFSMDSDKLQVSERTDYSTYYRRDTKDGYYFTKGATKIVAASPSGTEAVKVDSKTTFVLFDSTENTVKTYVGNNNAPTFSGATAIYGYQKTGANAASVVFVQVAETNLSSSLKDLVFAIVDDYDEVQTTNDNGDPISYYNVRTLDGSVIKTTLNASDGIAAKYSNYINAGVVVYKSANTDSNGRVTTFTAETDKVFTYNSSLTVKESNGVLYFGNSNPDRTYAEDVSVYEIAADADSFEKLDADYLNGLEDSYAGYTYVTDKDYVITTIVLKKA